MMLQQVDTFADRLTFGDHFFLTSCSSSQFQKYIKPCTALGFSFCWKIFSCNDIDLPNRKPKKVGLKLLISSYLIYQQNKVWPFLSCSTWVVKLNNKYSEPDFLQLLIKLLLWFFYRYLICGCTGNMKLMWDSCIGVKIMSCIFFASIFIIPGYMMCITNTSVSYYIDLWCN